MCAGEKTTTKTIESCFFPLLYVSCFSDENSLLIVSNQDKYDMKNTFC